MMPQIVRLARKGVILLLEHLDNFSLADGKTGQNNLDDRSESFLMGDIFFI